MDVRKKKGTAGAEGGVGDPSKVKGPPADGGSKGQEVGREPLLTPDVSASTDDVAGAQTAAPPDRDRSQVSVRAGSNRDVNKTSVVGLNHPDWTAAVRTVLRALPETPRSIGGPSRGHDPLQVRVDDLGITHVILQPKVGDLPIFGEEVRAQIHPDGAVRFFGSAEGALAITAPLAREPKGDQTQGAIERAKQVMAGAYQTRGEPKLLEAKNVLVRQPGADGGSVLTPAVHVCLSDFSDGPLVAHVLIEPDSGEALRHWNQLHRRAHADHGTPAAADGSQAEERPPAEQSPGVRARDDFARLVGQIDLQTTQTGDGFVLLTPDETVETRDANQVPAELIAGQFSLTSPVINGDDVWGGDGATRVEFAAIETHHASTRFRAFLAEMFGLNSIDDQGMKLEAMVNVGERFANAFWFQDIFHIGMGDGVVFDRLSSLDIVAHEIAHGLTENSADLIYDDQSGGLNESFSDILGTMFEWWYARNMGFGEAEAHPFDWLLGEDVFTPGIPGDALRSMSDPTVDRFSIDHFNDYNNDVDVHASSGIQNNAFFLTVEGGEHRLGDRVDGLREHFGDFDTAMTAAGQIWMRALQFYLMPSSDFAAARAATGRAAQDLFPDDPRVAEIITQAWDAVGVPNRDLVVA